MAITLDQPNRALNALTGERESLRERERGREMVGHYIKVLLFLDVLNAYGLASDQFYSSISSLDQDQTCMTGIFLLQ